MNDAWRFVVVVILASVAGSWVVWVTGSVLEEQARKRRARWFRAVLDRSQDFSDMPGANHAAQFLAEAARRRNEERAANLKEAGK